MSSLLKSVRSCWLSLALLCLNLALLMVMYDRLPDPMPSLWDDDGKVIDWIAKPAGALLLPIAHLIITLFMVIAPAVDPGALRGPQPPRVYPLIAAIVSGFLLLGTSLVFAASTDSSLNLPSAILAAIGLLLAVTGNYLGKIPKNYIIGIRTPWTLSSDYVWERTHRMAAPVFIGGGSILLLYCVLRRHELNSVLVSTVIISTIAAPCFYSFLVWRRVRAAEAT